MSVAEVNVCSRELVICDCFLSTNLCECPQEVLYEVAEAKYNQKAEPPDWVGAC